MLFIITKYAIFNQNMLSPSVSMKSKILPVDDSPFFVNVFEHVLSHRYKVEVAVEAETALQKYKAFKPNIVTLDPDMSGMNGFQMLEKILGIDRNAKVIITTARAFLTGDECLKRGAVGLLTKPFKSEDLIRTIEQSLASIKLVH